MGILDEHGEKTMHIIKTTKKLFPFVLCLILIFGCSESGNPTPKGKNEKAPNTTYSGTDMDDYYLKENEQGIRFGGYSDSSQNAYLKSSKNEIGIEFTSSGSNTLFLGLENNSLNNILITQAYVSVLDYRFVEYDDYVIEFAGGGDDFDPNLNLYAEVNNSKGDYLAYPITNDENGNSDTIVKDPVINLEISANDGINIVFHIHYLETGIYNYRINIEYEYNNSIYNIYEDCNILFDDISDFDIERKVDEFSDMYLQ